MNSIRIKIGFAFFAIAVIFIFQNCKSSSFAPVQSSEGDVTDPARLNNAKCVYDGKEYWHGDSIKTYLESSVAFDKSCVQQSHTCNNGAFSGTIGFKECGVGVARDCLIGPDTVKHNVEVTRFESSSVAYNQSCRSEVRKCFDGTISGSFTAKTCQPGAPPQPVNVFECKMREGQSNTMIMDLYQKWNDGTSRKSQTCSDWHSTRQNASWNCGKLTNGIYGQFTETAQQPSCCPQGKTVVNGHCMPIAQVGEACYGSANCADGLECTGNEPMTASNPYGRRCQPK